MATYLGTHGSKIQTYTSDPSNPNTGEVWYNATANTIKIQATTVAGAWATGGSLNTPRAYAGGCGATKDASLCFGDGPPPAPTASGITESYNGTAWTEVNDMNTAKAFVTGAGTYTSAIAAGGDQFSGVAESWNGTNWTSITNEPNGSNAYGSAGADNTNALFFGGVPAPTRTVTRYWNGSSWTDLNALNGSKKDLDGAGKTYTAALAIGGSAGPTTAIALTESFNGTNWTEVNDLNTARRFAAANGTQTSALIYAGLTPPPVTNKTEEWNGTNWAETTNYPLSVTGNTGAGADNTNALGFGGTPPETNATLEWTGAGAPVVKTISTD
jgi:hypothetical protein